jgi:hypothetical protein
VIQRFKRLSPAIIDGDGKNYTRMSLLALQESLTGADMA